MNTQNRSLVLLAIAGVAMATFSLTAVAGTLSISTTAPTVDGLDIANLAAGTATQKWFDDVEHDAGQTFTTTVAGKLNSFTIHLSAGQEVDTNESIFLRLGTITRPGGVFTFTDIYQETIAWNDTTSADWLANDYITFSYDTPQTLAAGVEYGVITDGQSFGAWQNGIPYRHRTGDVLAGGSLINRGGETAGSDLVFHADISPVPEPTTFALAGLGLFGLIGFRRRRR